MEYSTFRQIFKTSVAHYAANCGANATRRAALSGARAARASTRSGDGATRAGHVVRAAEPPAVRVVVVAGHELDAFGRLVAGWRQAPAAAAAAKGPAWKGAWAATFASVRAFSYAVHCRTEGPMRQHVSAGRQGQPGVRAECVREGPSSRRAVVSGWGGPGSSRERRA